MEASLAEPGELNPVTLEGELAYAAMGFGEYAAGPGQPRVQRTDLGGETAFGARRSLTFFTHLADSQLVDDESPARIAWEPPPRAPQKRVYMPKRRTRRPPVSRVPWSLLDELDAEKEKFAMQQVGDTFKDRFEAADAKKKRVRRRFVE